MFKSNFLTKINYRELKKSNYKFKKDSNGFYILFKYSKAFILIQKKNTDKAELINKLIQHTELTKAENLKNIAFITFHYENLKQFNLYVLPILEENKIKRKFKTSLIKQLKARNEKIKSRNKAQI